jgi:hypothetical protein
VAWEEEAETEKFAFMKMEDSMHKIVLIQTAKRA